MKRWGFNTARLAFRFPDCATASHYSPLDYAQLEQVLALLSQNGINAILDCHNWQDTSGCFGSAAWQQDWINLAAHVKGDNRIVGLDLANEPTPDTWTPSITTTQQLVDVLGACADAIKATGNTHKIIFPAPWYYTGAIIPASRKPDIIIDWHLYMTTKYPNTAVGAQQKVTDDLGGMQSWINNGFSIWVGETGPRAPPIDYNVEKTYVVGTIHNCATVNCGFSLWSYSLNHWTVGSYDDILAAAGWTQQARYVFSHWNDGSTNPMKTVTI